ncbi:MAG TPA: tetratricopeptide repeat protein [Thermoanaerobaculia bacterium]|nr:tetratricopeptide repeat protein [Thermoanaerobaculia bacterium]
MQAGGGALGVTGFPGMLSSPVPGYTTRDVARLLGASEERVRSFVRAGFLEPRRGAHGGYLFSFQDLVVLRAAQGLLDGGVPPRRVRRALARLQEQLPRGRSLATVRIAAEGGAIVVRAGGEAWIAESGQQVLDFEVAPLAAAAAPFSERSYAAARERGDLEDDDWYDVACELEVTAPDAAKDAYRRALALDPEHPDAHLNLGRLLHEEGDAAGAAAHYRRALAARPGDVTASFNLGVALQDLDLPREAIAAYEQALAGDPTCMDAHYNLAGLHEELGEAAEAIRHLSAYKKLIET